jgi:hypothetical protein
MGLFGNFDHFLAKFAENGHFVPMFQAQIMTY